MIRLSIPLRQALSRLTLPVLAVTAFCLMLLGKADVLLAERLRAAFGDSLAPLYAILSLPAEAVRGGLDTVSRGFTVLGQDDELRAENEKLRKWQAVALALDAENASLRAQLHFIPSPAPRFVTAHAVADTGGIYARSVLVAIGPNRFVRRGQIVLDAAGLVGRVTEAGRSSARILLITDLNSRVPVRLAESGAHAILAGTNADTPVLRFLPQGVAAREGERVLTDDEAGVFPAGLPVGRVHLRPGHAPEILPDAALNRLDLVRIFDYGLSDRVPPEAPSAPPGKPRPVAPVAAVAAASTLPAGWYGAPDRAPANRVALAASLAAHAAPRQALPAEIPPIEVTGGP